MVEKRIAANVTFLAAAITATVDDTRSLA